MDPKRVGKVDGTARQCSDCMTYKGTKMPHGLRPSDQLEEVKSREERNESGK